MRGFRQWRWHLDEMYVKVNGEMRYLWRGVDHEDKVLESFVTKDRNKAAAMRFMKEALKRHGSPDTITTDGLRRDPQKPNSANRRFVRLSLTAPLERLLCQLGAILMQNMGNIAAIQIGMTNSKTRYLNLSN